MTLSLASKRVKYFATFLFFGLVSLEASDPILSVNTKKWLSSGERAAMLIAHVKDSIYKADHNSSKLTEQVLNLPGMSSPKVRHLLNNLCSLPSANYLEIGVWKGSTFISALFRNNANVSSAMAIDNWSEFHGSKEEFIFNCAQFLPDIPFCFYSAHCFNLDVKAICKNPINIYFYDGNHSTHSHKLAFTYYNSILDDVFIAIIDDWNFPNVSMGTRSAFHKLRYNILYETILPARYIGDTLYWWNGLYIAVIHKP